MQSALIKWLKRLALYFGAVFVATAAGVFFFWQIPLLQDLPQLLKNIAINDPVIAKPAAPANPPAPALAGGAQTDADPARPAQIETPAAEALPPQPLAPKTEAVAAAQQPPAPPPSASEPLPAPTGAITVHKAIPPTEPETAAPPPPDPAAPPPTTAATGQPAAGSAPGSGAVAPGTPAAGAAQQPATATAGQPGSTVPAPAVSATGEPVPVPPPVSPQEIEQLLADARQQMENRRLTSPASGNALRTYQRVLELEPTNPTALEGVQRITTYYQEIARQSLQQGRTDEGLAYINRGLRAAPKSEVLLSLRREARLAKQREDERRQALLAERQRQEAEQQLIQQQTRQRLQEPPPRFQEPPPQQTWRPRSPQQQPPQYNDSGFNQR